MSSSDESEHSIVSADEVVTGSELIPLPKYRELMFAKHWYTHARHLKLSKRAWQALLKHARPMTLIQGPGLSNFCRSNGLPYEDKETLTEFQKKNGIRKTGPVRRCMGISVLRGTRCRSYQRWDFCALHYPYNPEPEVLDEIPLVIDLVLPNVCQQDGEEQEE